MALGLFAGALTATGALAGECPKDKVLAKPQEIRDAPDVGIDREILSTVKLHGWRKAEHLELRMRRLVVAVDGIVPTHDHDDWPSIVYVAKGEIIEHSAFCAVPILHREGEWSPEFGAGHKHWWENRSGQEVVLISTDVVPSEMIDDPHM
jgi:quercetin dioxygenase-like cupin family protein